MSESPDLYQEAIKRLATASHSNGRLERPDGEAKLTNPLCGDRVSLQVALDHGRIAAIAHETRGCLLCRAAASLLGIRAVGLDAEGVEATIHAVEALLKEHAPVPPDWPELEMFQPARAYPSRHKCALLPFRALQEAMRVAMAAS